MGLVTILQPNVTEIRGGERGEYHEEFIIPES